MTGRLTPTQRRVLEHMAGGARLQSGLGAIRLYPSSGPHIGVRAATLRALREAGLVEEDTASRIVGAVHAIRTWRLATTADGRGPERGG